MTRSWTQGRPVALVVAGLYMAAMLLLDINGVVLPSGIRIALAFAGALLAVLAGAAMSAYRARNRKTRNRSAT